MYQIVFCLLISISTFSCESTKAKSVNDLPFYTEATFSPIFVQASDSIPILISHQIDRFSLLNQDSISISNKEVERKIHLANFIFTSCGSICPIMTKNMKSISNEFTDNDNVAFLSFSVTPWIDTPSKLFKYKQRNEIENPNWHFLTGNKADIYHLARNSYFAEEELGLTKDSSEFLHTEHFILVDDQLRIRGIYNGTLALEAKQVIKDIKVLLK